LQVVSTATGQYRQQMDDYTKRAEAALKAGKRDEAIDFLVKAKEREQAIELQTKRGESILKELNPATSHRALARTNIGAAQQLAKSGRFDEAAFSITRRLEAAAYRTRLAAEATASLVQRIGRYVPGAGRVVAFLAGTYFFYDDVQARGFAGALANLAIDSTPIVGDARALYELYTGEEIFPKPIVARAIEKLGPPRSEVYVDDEGQVIGEYVPSCGWKFFISSSNGKIYRDF